MSYYEEDGIDPNSRDHGYECRKCGYIPTQRELDNGYCKCRKRDESTVEEQP